VTDTAGIATLSQVAEHAGVSLATASRALNGSVRQVNPELKERVLASALTLGYSPNAQAQAVARGTSNTVALVVGDIADPYFSALASGVIHAADQRGLIVTMAATGIDPDREISTLAALRGQRPRAVILAGSRRIDRSVESRIDHELTAIENAGGHVALIGSRSPGFKSVAILNREGAAALADALVDRGYRDFVVLAGGSELHTARERTAGFVDAALARGVEISSARVSHGEFSRDGGYATMAALLADGVRPDCVFAVTDVMALGAMAALREAGITPGTEVAVAGFDDIQLVQDVSPSLTTVALPLADIGARALEIALSVEPDDSLTTPFEGSVVLRDSTPGR
jgi:LacI family transcriptional regulator